MKNIDLKQVAIYGGLALIAYKLFNTKVNISTGLQPSGSTGINLNVTGGSSGSTSTIPSGSSTIAPQPDKVVDVAGPASTSPVNTLNPYMGIAPSPSIYDQVINVVW